MHRFIALACACLLTAACTDTPDSPEPDPVLGHCIYINIFSNAEECKEYRGVGWSSESGIDDCNGQLESAFATGSCPYEDSLGYCLFDEGEDDMTHIVFPGDDVDECASSEMGCELFGGGEFVPESRCEPYVDDQDMDGIGSGGSVFQPGSSSVASRSQGTLSVRRTMAMSVRGRPLVAVLKKAKSSSITQNVHLY